ncbi:MAG: glycosyltransferase family 4 protein [Armatimonadota bacterium]|nr:glycosyltransferase family 4 protein [Armatimonadota bacterium]MCX7777121.1 glycosyltransferase family 4 protein [Armatimonadota bacterium]MDW8025168.1 glycosyltransferase family 4 protein [Armatimonadota bacterium]
MSRCLSVSLITSWNVDCGIARYSAELVGALRKLVDIIIIPFGPQVWQRLNLPTDTAAQRTRAIEAANLASHTNIAHIQFQPQFFGGMHPLRCTFPMLLMSLKVPAVVTVHELDIHGAFPISSVKLLINIWLFRRQRIKHFIVHNEFTKRCLGKLGISQECVSVIPMWAPKVKQSRFKRQEVRKLLGLSSRHVIGAFGFIVKRRGYDLLLEALEPFPSDTLLVIIGGKHPLDRSGYYESFIERLTNWRWSDKVIVKGFVSEDELPLWFSAIDFVVAPFTQLTASASLLRCIAYGLPIICSDLEPLRELQEMSKCMRLFGVGDAVSLRGAILELLNDDALRECLSQNALSFASSYTVEDAAKLTAQAYTQVLRHG